MSAPCGYGPRWSSGAAELPAAHRRFAGSVSLNSLQWQGFGPKKSENRHRGNLAGKGDGAIIEKS
jgi:hypothetical protein